MPERREGGIAAKCRDQPWNCKRCGLLLGFAMDIEGKTHLRIKVGDEGVHVVEPERVVRQCRRCLFLNELHKLGPDGEEPDATTGGIPAA